MINESLLSRDSNSEENKICRYCLTSDSDRSEIISPCRCSGSLKYVHQNCLLKWYNSKNQEIVIPGKFTQFNFQCEICKTPYNIIYNENKEILKSVWIELILYVLSITFMLNGLYIITGSFLTYQNVLLYDMQDFWKNTFLNGFLATHLIIGTFYLFLMIYNCHSGEDCLCCFLFDPEGDSGLCDNIHILCFLLVLIGIMCSVLIIYFDILGRVYQKHKNLKKQILQIKNFV